MRMYYSDLSFTSNIKVEILPSDNFGQKENYFVDGDRLIGVFRPVGNPIVADSLNRFFFEEFYSCFIDNQLPISEAMQATIHALNFSQLNFLGEQQSAPEGGAMVLIVYLDPHNTLTLAQVGDIKLKKRNNRRYNILTQDHTFDNQLEMKRLSQFLKNSGTESSVESVTTLIASTEGFTAKIPSRFIGHPSWCGLGGEYGESMISTEPFITTFSS